MAKAKQLKTEAQIAILQTQATVQELEDALEAVGPNHVLYAPFTEELRLIKLQLNELGSTSIQTAP